MAAEHNRPGGLGQGYFCIRCGAEGLNMYGTGHGVGLCAPDQTLVEQLVKLNGTEPQLTAPPLNKAEAPGIVDFTVNIYRGCVLPEDYKPARVTTWTQWAAENPDDYSPDQLSTIRLRLLAGKSWVAFCKTLETISAPDFYRITIHNINPVRPKDRLP